MKSPWQLSVPFMVGQPTVSTLLNDILSSVCAGELEQGVGDV